VSKNLDIIMLIFGIQMFEKFFWARCSSLARVAFFESWEQAFSYWFSILYHCGALFGGMLIVRSEIEHFLV